MRIRHLSAGSVLAGALGMAALGICAGMAHADPPAPPPLPEEPGPSAPPWRTGSLLPQLLGPGSPLPEPWGPGSPVPELLPELLGPGSPVPELLGPGSPVPQPLGPGSPPPQPWER